MSKSNQWENDLLLLLFNNTDCAKVGDAGGLRGSVTAGSLYVSLHTADPGEGGLQTTSETAYTGYARVGVARSAGGWTIIGNSVSPTLDSCCYRKFNRGSRNLRNYVSGSIKALFRTETMLKMERSNMGDIIC